MRIVETRMQRVRLPLVHAFETSSHRKNALDHILVRLTSDTGAVGWGEIASPSDPYYCAETVDTCWLIAEHHILPAVLGTEFEHATDVVPALSRIRGNNFARAGFDVALWALSASEAGVSLATSLGGTRDEVAAGVSLGIEPTVDDLLAQVAAQVDTGYGRVKLKIRPGWDVEPVRAVRAAFADLTLQVDANGAYTTGPDDLVALMSLDDTGLAMIEQPFAPRDLIAHAELQRRLQTPICLDESIETVEDLETALRLDAVRVVNIKVSRMGGLSPAIATHDRAFGEGIPVWCGGMHEFGIGRAANLALSSLPGFTRESDVSGSDKYYARDVTREPILAHAGRVEVPRGVGIGVDADEEFIAANATATLGKAL